MTISLRTQLTSAIRFKTLSEEEEERILNGTSSKCLEVRTNSAISRAFSIPPPLPSDSAELLTDVIILVDDSPLSQKLNDLFENVADRVDIRVKNEESSCFGSITPVKGKYSLLELLLEAPHSVPILFNRGEIDPETFIYSLPASEPPPNLPENHCYSGNLDLIFINGILNDQESGMDGARYIQKLAGGPPITFVHLPSFGFSYDIALSNSSRDGGAINSTALALEQVIYNSIEKSNPNDKIVIVCHSAGAIITDGVIKRIPQEYHSRLAIIAVAPGKFILKGEYEHINIISEGGGDPVVAWQYELKKKAEEEGGVISIPKHRQGGILFHLWVDHELQSPTFQEHLKRLLKDSTSKYNAWSDRN